MCVCVCVCVFTEDILTALASAADTGVYGFTGVPVAALVSGGATDTLVGAKLTPNVDLLPSLPVSGVLDVSSASDLTSVLLDSIFLRESGPLKRPVFTTVLHEEQRAKFKVQSLRRWLATSSTYDHLPIH